MASGVPAADVHSYEVSAQAPQLLELNLVLSPCRL